jgi:hypothetical protein
MTLDDLREWIWSGLTHQGGFDRPLYPSRWPVPVLTSVYEGNLRALFSDDGPEASLDQDVLSDFVQLADLTDVPEELSGVFDAKERVILPEFERAINEYASRFGILGICEHNLPASHPSLNFRQQDPRPCEPRKDGADYIENVGHWLSYARQARALLNVAAAIYSDDKGRQRDWEELVSDGERLLEGGDERRKGLVSFYVHGWMRVGGVHLDMPWEGPSPEIRVMTHWSYGLFGAVAIQLALAISRTDGLAICSACGEPFVPSRKPAPGRRAYCARPRCSQKARWRDAKREERRRKEGANGEPPRSR